MTTAEEITRDIVVAMIKQSGNYNPREVIRRNTRDQIGAVAESYRQIYAAVLAGAQSPVAGGESDPGQGKSWWERLVRGMALAVAPVFLFVYLSLVYIS